MTMSVVFGLITVAFASGCGGCLGWLWAGQPRRLDGFSVAYRYALGAVIGYLACYFWGVA